MPSEEQIAGFTHEVNDVLRMRKAPTIVDNLAAGRCREVGEALRTLRRELTVMLKKKELVAHETDHAEAIIASAEWLLKEGPFGEPARTGSKGKSWAAGARLFSRRAIAAWQAAGVPNPSPQTVDGPVVKLVARALEHIDGTAPELDTIAQQLKRARRRLGQIKKQI